MHSQNIYSGTAKFLCGAFGTNSENLFWHDAAEQEFWVGKSEWIFWPMHLRGTTLCFMLRTYILAPYRRVNILCGTVRIYILAAIIYVRSEYLFWWHHVSNSESERLFLMDDRTAQRISSNLLDKTSRAPGRGRFIMNIPHLVYQQLR